MRKLLMTMAALAVTLCFINDVHAFDVKNKFLISGHGGLAIPVGEFADDDTSNAAAGGANNGFNLGIAVEYGIAEQFLIGGRFAYNRFKGDHDFFENTLPTEEFLNGHWTVTEVFGVYAKWLSFPTSSLRPFVRGGFFVGIPTAHSEGFRSLPGIHDFDASVGFDAAIGATRMFSRHVGAGIEFRFAHLPVNDKDPADSEVSQYSQTGVTAPIGVRDPGGNIDWLAASAYLSYGF